MPLSIGVGIELCKINLVLLIILIYYIPTSSSLSQKITPTTVNDSHAHPKFASYKDMIVKAVYILLQSQKCRKLNAQIWFYAHTSFFVVGRSTIKKLPSDLHLRVTASV
jgi:hypothetical protein